MPYSQVTVDQLAGQLGTLLDDPNSVYWTLPEKRAVIQEGLYYWGALTNYWRGRGTFTVTPSSPTFRDLSVELPLLRARVVTLDQIVRQIQFMLLEASNGISGTNMSGQVTIADILQAVKWARNQFVLDTRLPLSVHAAFGGPPPSTGVLVFDQSSVFVHRAAWQDSTSSIWTNLWREDAWSVDKGNPQWTVESGNPLQYSEAENAPLILQISPPPANNGQVEAVTVDSLQIDTTNPAALFSVPDEWVHAIKYAALSQLLGGGGQIVDPVRAQYCEQRYQQSVTAAKEARSIIRLLVNNVPLPIDSLASIDAGTPYWRTQTVDLSMPGTSIGVLYDMVAFPPVLNSVSISADVVQSAPVPGPSDPIQMGTEDQANLVDYCTHVLLFKCGGNEFKGTMAQYDSFMNAAALRGRINQAKIRYLAPLFGQPQREWRERLDRAEVTA